MKRIIILIVSLLWGVTQLSAQNRSINFFEGSLKEAIAEAARSHKPIFIDCYTSWCGPCKWMAREVFTNDTVADYFNERFINLKVDCEKKEGPQIAKNYGVSSFPTFLYLNERGELIHKMSGGSPASIFISRTEQGLDMENNLYGMTRRYHNGESSLEFLEHFYVQLNNIRDVKLTSEVGEKILTMLPADSLFTPRGWKYLSHFRVSQYGSDRWNFLLKNDRKFQQIVGNDVFSGMVGDRLHIYLFRHITGTQKAENPMSEIDACEKLIKHYHPYNEQILYSFLRLARSRCSQDFNGFFATVINEYSQGGLDKSEHYRIMYNLIDYLCTQMNDSQRNLLRETLLDSQKLQNELMGASYSTLFEKLKAQ